MKERLDVLLVQRGLAVSREKAKAVIMAGDVLVNGQREDKAGTMIDEKAEIILKGNRLPYVSRGGLKLEKAMKSIGITLDGRVCMGSSTGSCETTSASSAWRRRTFAMLYRRIFRRRRRLCRSTCRSFL